MENNKIKKEINDIVKDNLKALEQLFPSAIKDGQLDIKALKEELGDFEEVTTEKYELNWSGKQNAKKMVQQGIENKTLKFVAKDSKNADTTENIYIEGDNLEVLKLLRQNYYNSIKMIYIDPPYNTGNDFVYNDIFKMDKEESDKAEGIISENNEKLQKNQKSTNRYHANWLNMMYPRLKLARDLLTDDGVIFISIDDNEQANLKRLCDEIFGEENFVGSLTVENNPKGRKNSDFISVSSEYCVIYSKNKEESYFIENIPKPSDDMTLDENGRYVHNSGKRVLVGENKYNAKVIKKESEKNYSVYYNEKNNTIECRKEDFNEINYELIKKGFRKYFSYNEENLIENTYTEGKFRELFVNGALYFSENKIYEKNYKDTIRIKNVLVNKKYSAIVSGIKRDYSLELRTTGANDLIKELFENILVFEATKNVGFLKILITLFESNDFTILDFFSGSATTAHAVMQLNSEDNGNRKYIMVQLPETTDEKSEAFKAGYKNIAEIGKERIRRAGEKIKQEIEEYNSNLKLGEEPKKVPDIGFKAFKVDDTNIKWYDLENFNEKSQYSFDDPDSLDFVLGSNDIDIVYEIILRQNDVPLSESLEVLTDIGNRTYLYASTYLICLETEITEEMVEKLASLDPLPIKFVFRDSAFKDNISLKDETFRKLRSLIERNLGESKVSYRIEFI